MKVLIISHNPISNQSNMGKTFLSLFSQFDKEELCQLYIYPVIPNEDFSHNSGIPAARLEEFCCLGKKEMTYMEGVYNRMNLTARTFHKILRVARTLADMEQKKEISICHLNEAICYRNVDEKFWGGIS